MTNELDRSKWGHVANVHTDVDAEYLMDILRQEGIESISKFADNSEQALTYMNKEHMGVEILVPIEVESKARTVIETMDKSDPVKIEDVDFEEKKE